MIVELASGGLANRGQTSMSCSALVPTEYSERVVTVVVAADDVCRSEHDSFLLATQPAGSEDDIPTAKLSSSRPTLVKRLVEGPNLS